MTVALTQSEAAAFPDRPREGSRTGLQVSLASGTDGRYLAHTLSAPPTRLHLRLLLNPATTANGTVAIARGLDAGAVETWRLVFDAQAGTVTLQLPTSQTLTATLPGALSWHCLEFALDTVAGAAELWLNGNAAAQLGGSFTTLVTADVWLGGFLKDENTTGELYLDEWIVADDYIGPAIVAPVHNHGGDPARWAVIYNTASSDSIAWVESYRMARRVPLSNLIGLNLPVSESIDTAGFAALDTAIADYLGRNHLDGHIIGLLFGHAVPGYVDFSGVGPQHAVADLQHRASPDPGLASNPLAADQSPERPTATQLGDLRLTARIDGPDLAAANALVDRATALITNGLDATDGGDKATIYLDPYTTPGPINDPIIAAMVNWSASLGRMRTHLPIVLSAAEDPQQEVQFPSIANDGFFWGWSAAAPAAGFFAEPAGARVFCFQLDSTGPTAPTLRDPTPADWMDSALASGFAAATGASRAYSASLVPNIGPFFAALRQGWTLAEAWFVACPVLRGGLFLAGDPLLTVETPKDGWEVFGPLDHLENLDPSAPSAALPADENAFVATPPEQNGPANTVIYHLRRTDEHGRSETGTTLLRAQRVGDLALTPPRQPIWPACDNWSVPVASHSAVLAATWDRTMLRANIETVQLESRVELGAPFTVAALIAGTRQRVVEIQQPLTELPTQYRWVFTSPDGAVIHTPWSQPVQRRAVSNLPLPVIA